MRKTFMILGIVILVLIVAAVLFFYANRTKLASLMVEKSLPHLETLVVQNLPAELNKEQVHDQFVKFSKKFKTGQYDKQEMQALFLKFKSAMDDKKIDSTEVKSILASLEKLNK
jgi:hypothetical protein